MALTVPNFPIFINAICVVLVNAVHQASTGDSSGILARLYKQAAQQNRPLVLVLDNSAHVRHRDVVPKAKHAPVSVEQAEKNINLPFIYMSALDKAQKVGYANPTKFMPYSDNSKDDKENRPRNRNRVRKQKLNLGDVRDMQEYKDSQQERNMQKIVKWEDKDLIEEKRVLRSPVIRSLLRISNSLRCGARDDCQDECNGKYDGKKLDDCEDKCEVKYDCEEEEPEEEPEKDPCEKGECEASDECGGSNECTGSTKGERLVAVTPKCKRC